MMVMRVPRTIHTAVVVLALEPMLAIVMETGFVTTKISVLILMIILLAQLVMMVMRVHLAKPMTMIATAQAVSFRIVMVMAYVILKTNALD